MQESYIPNDKRQEEIIKRLELFKGRKIRLIDVDIIEKDPSKKLAGLAGILGEDIRIGEPIILTRGKDEVGTKEVRNISFENGVCLIQTHGGVIYKLEIL